MKVGAELLYLSQSDVKNCIQMKDVVKLVEEGIRAFGEGKVTEEKFYLPVKKHGGFIKPMCAYMEPKEVLMTKLFSLFQDNPVKYGLPSASAIIILNDPRTGIPIAVMDGNWITSLKTGATTAVAAKYLAKKSSSVAGIIGAGVQGRGHLTALNEVFHIKEVRVTDTSRETRERYAKEMGERLKLNVIPVDSTEQAVRGVDMAVTVTTADEPLVKKEWIEPGKFIAKVGSFQELDPAVITAVDKVVVDLWKYTAGYKRVKELVKLVEAGVFTRQDIYAELPEILTGRKIGRENDDETTLFISIGFGADNAAVASQVYQRAIELGIGQKLKM